MKLNVLLGLRERLEKSFSNGVDDIFNKFKNKQGLFKGERKTYIAKDGFADEPSKRSFTAVSSTVNEQFNWLATHSQDFLKNVFSIEKTNSMGIANSELIVEGEVWGTYSTLELLRLKSILDGKLKAMISEAPVRSESIIWTKSQNELYNERAIFETSLETGFAKTTLKESYILSDPHAGQGVRNPIVAEKSTQVNIGEYTAQYFSGELSMLERAKIIVRYEKLYQAVIEALEKANNVEIVESDLGNKLFSYIFKLS